MTLDEHRAAWGQWRQYNRGKAPKGFITDIFGNIRNLKDFNMAWDWERGCDVPDMATAQPLFTPPDWKPFTLQALARWYAVEILIVDLVASGRYTVASTAEAQARVHFDSLENIIVQWENVRAKAHLRKGYIEWLANNINSLGAFEPAAASKVAKVMDDLEIDALPDLERIIEAGYKALARKAHPDNKETGSTEKFQKLSASKEQLSAILLSVKDLLK